MPIEPDDENQIEYVSHAEARRVSGLEPTRGYVETDRSITYISYMPEFLDFCQCEFTLMEGGWVETFRSLTPDERLAGEEIQDETILELAKSGKMVTAIRLYRTKHQAGLKAAFEAVQALVRLSYN